MDEIIHDHVARFLDQHGLRWEGNKDQVGSAVLEALLIELIKQIIEEIDVGPKVDYCEHCDIEAGYGHKDGCPKIKR